MEKPTLENNITDGMTSHEKQLTALNTLINGIKIAQKRGAYELPEAEILWQAIKVFLYNSEENSNEPGPEVSFNNQFMGNKK